MGKSKHWWGNSCGVAAGWGPLLDALFPSGTSKQSWRALWDCSLSLLTRQTWRSCHWPREQKICVPCQFAPLAKSVSDNKGLLELHPNWSFQPKAITSSVECTGAFRNWNHLYVCHGGQTQGAPLSLEWLAYCTCDANCRDYEVVSLQTTWAHTPLEASYLQWHFQGCLGGEHLSEGLKVLNVCSHISGTWLLALPWLSMSS